jgi:hypothetical protein
MERLILACLAKEAKDRPASAAIVERTLSTMIEPRSWTQDDAQTWWRDHRDDLVRARAARMKSSPSLALPRIQRSATLVA